jgi:hypothetical protein
MKSSYYETNHKSKRKKQLVIEKADYLPKQSRDSFSATICELCAELIKEISFGMHLKKLC